MVKNKIYLAGNFKDYNCIRYYEDGKKDESFQKIIYKKQILNQMYIDYLGQLYFTFYIPSGDTSTKLMRFNEYGILPFAVELTVNHFIFNKPKDEYLKPDYRNCIYRNGFPGEIGP